MSASDGPAKPLGLLSGVLIVAAVSLSLHAQQAVVRPQEGKQHTLEALLDGSGFAPIPAGEFMMGSTNGTASEQPVHRVRISKGFDMGRFEVTQGQWEAVMASAHPSTEGKDPKESAPSTTNPSHFRGVTSPVENVSWADVQLFLQTLNGRDPSHVYRLPTEAEWEYVAKAGTGNTVPNLITMAWFDANSGGQTQPAGQKAPNASGLYDMQGNVAEWVQDWYAPNYYESSPATDPTGPEAGSYRVYRGCWWFSPAADCRAALRTFNFPNDRYYNVGFRLVRTSK